MKWVFSIIQRKSVRLQKPKESTLIKCAANRVEKSLSRFLSPTSRGGREAHLRHEGDGDVRVGVVADELDHRRLPKLRLLPERGVREVVDDERDDERRRVLVVVA